MTMTLFIKATKETAGLRAVLRRKFQIFAPLHGELWHTEPAIHLRHLSRPLHDKLESFFFVVVFFFGLFYKERKERNKYKTVI